MADTELFNIIDTNGDKQINDIELKTWFNKKKPTEIQTLVNTLSDEPLKTRIQELLKSAEVTKDFSTENATFLEKSNKLSDLNHEILSNDENLKVILKNPKELLNRPFNKKDLITFIEKIKEVKLADNSPVKEVIPGIITIAMDRIATNGFTIESKNDLKFLKDNGGDELKNKLPQEFSTAQYIIKENGEFKIKPLGTEDLKKELPKSLNTFTFTQLAEEKNQKEVQKILKIVPIEGEKLTEADLKPFIEELGKIPGLGDFLKGLFKLIFGLSGIKKGPEEALKEEDKPKFLGEMLGKDGIFEKESIGKIKEDTNINEIEPKEDKQKYISQVQRLLGVEDKDAKGELVYGEKTQEKVKNIQKTLNPSLKDTGVFDIQTAKAYLASFEVKTQPERAAPQPTDVAPATIAKDTTPEKTTTTMPIKTMPCSLYMKWWKQNTEIKITLNQSITITGPVESMKLSTQPTPTRVFPVKIGNVEGFIAESRFLDKKPKAK